MGRSKVSLKNTALRYLELSRHDRANSVSIVFAEGGGFLVAASKARSIRRNLWGRTW